MKKHTKLAAVLGIAAFSMATAGVAGNALRSAQVEAPAPDSLVDVLARVVSGLPETTDSGTYEAQLAGSIESSGANCKQIDEALGALRGRTGLTPAAVSAIQRLLQTVDGHGCRLQVGSVNSGGGSAPFGASFAFSGGGGGSDYTPL
jgi:hypothetical protein